MKTCFFLLLAFVSVGLTFAATVEENEKDEALAPKAMEEDHEAELQDDQNEAEERDDQNDDQNEEAEEIEEPKEHQEDQKDIPIKWRRRSPKSCCKSHRMQKRCTTYECGRKCHKVGWWLGERCRWEVRYCRRCWFDRVCERYGPCQG